MISPTLLLNELHFIEDMERRYTWEVRVCEWVQDPHSATICSRLIVREFAPVWVGDMITLTLQDILNNNHPDDLVNLVEGQFHVAIASIEWFVEELWHKAVLPPDIPAGE